MKATNQVAILCAAASASASAAQNTRADDASTIHWSPSPDAGNVTTVDKGYIGFGIEMTSFPDYAGGGDTPNQLSSYLLTQISTRTGGAPIHIRVGGTSMDNAAFNPNLTTAAVNVTGDQHACNLHAAAEVGTPWLRGFANLAAALAPRYTVQVPLARKSVDNGVAFANACLAALGGSGRLDAFEIGNEPNYYPTLGCNGATDRAHGWGPADYAREWAAYAATLARRVGALKDSTAKEWFQTLTLASEPRDPAAWKLSGIWDELDRDGRVKTVAQHYYQGDASKGLKEELLTHSTTVARMQRKFGANLAFAQQHNTPFLLAEVGSALPGGSGTPNPQLYGSLGAALWTLDFLLHGMSMGIAGVSMHLGTHFRFSAWQPVDREGFPKAVHGNYYGLVAAAEFVGGDGALQVRPLDLPTPQLDVAGYAGYHGGKLSKIALLNLALWNGTGADRPEQKLALTQLGADVTHVRVSKLTAPGGATAESGISWAGKRWTAENDGTEHADGEKPVTIDVKDGAPTKNVVVKASEAVVVEILRG